MKVQFGKNISQKNDPLYDLSLERLFQGIKHSKPQLKDQITHLRTIASLNPNQYKQLKKRLPYFVCGIFHPHFRRKEHFASIQCFMIDIDHLSVHDIHKKTLLDKLTSDPRVAIVFTSPSGDGLKIMFLLQDPCKDEALFSAFYTLFATQFAAQYDLAQAIDYQTKDVTRACFLSHDPDAYYNTNAQTVCIETYIPHLDFERAEKDIVKANKMVASSQKEKTQATPDQDVLDRVRQKLNPKTAKRVPKNIVMPPQLTDFLVHLRENIGAYNIEIKNDKPINYGRQLTLGAGHIFCEINLFFGKKGFRVVKTTKSGSNADLATLAADAIEEIIAQYETFQTS